VSPFITSLPQATSSGAALLKGLWSGHWLSIKAPLAQAGDVTQWYRACLARTRPWAPSPALINKQTNNVLMNKSLFNSRHNLPLQQCLRTAVYLVFVSIFPTPPSLGLFV
jgi:hypothetical protein